MEGAQVYLEASAWESAEGLLAPHMRSLIDAAEFPVDAVHPLTQLVTAWRRLGKRAPVAVGTARIRGILKDRDRHAPDAWVLGMLCLSSEEFDKGRSERACELLKLADQVPENSIGPWIAGRKELMWCRIALSNNELHEAEMRCLEAARRAGQANCDGQLGDAYVLLGLIARRRGRMRESIALYGKARAHYEQTADAASMTITTLNLANCHAACGEITEALNLYRATVSMSNRQGRRGTSMRARLGEGYCLTRQGQLQRGREILLSAWRLARELGLRREEANALEYLIFLYVTSGHLAKARRALGVARRIMQGMTELPDLAIEIAIQLAGLRLAEGNPREAIVVSRKASKEAKLAELAWERAVALRTLGVALAHTGARRRALEVFHTAKEVLQKLSEGLESALVSAWILALERSTGKDAVGALAQFVAGIDAEQESVVFWLKHELWGPLSWAESRQKAARGMNCPGRRDNSLRQYANASVVLTGDLEAKDTWRRIGLVTRAGLVCRVLHTAETYATTKLPVLILGETGTGKDLIAQGVHSLSGCKGHYVPVNCAAASRDLFAAELFGARKGAYTGAVENREGLIRRAQAGSIFLDEIADLDMEAQGYLLRFLDSGEVRPVGASESIRVETRVIAATCRDLRGMAEKGRFRADLLNRLSGLSVRMPALRERPEDLEILVESLWQREGGLAGTWRAVFNGSIVARLSQYSWPGNVRELRHTVARALQFSAKHGEAAARREIVRELEDDANRIDAGSRPPSLEEARL